MEIDLSGRLAVVTGASGDLGRVIALTLAGCGADVAVHYHRNGRDGHALAEQIRGLGRRSLAVQADITERGAVLLMRDTIAEQLGEPDIVVNNAVIQYPWTSVLEQGLDDFETQFRSCVLQNVLMAQAFVPAMVKRGGGRIVAINTECAAQCLPNTGAYVSGKRGMDGVLRVLAREVGAHGITVNQVAPGWMISARDRATGTQKSPEYEARVPLNRRGEDRDIANAVAFLASDLAAFITGVFLPVSGGTVMPGI